MSTDKPLGQIRPQTNLDTIAVSDATLVDDTVALVDGTSLVGGTTSSISNILTKTRILIPRFIMKVRR